MANLWDEPADPHPLANEFASDGPVADPGLDLPEIAAMGERGWRLIECESPGNAAFAALWQPAQRSWLPDRRVPTWEVHHDVGRVEYRKATAEEIAQFERDFANAMEARALPPPPRGRLWFVRLPNSWQSVGDYVEDLYRRVDAEGLEEFAGSAWNDFVREQIERDFGPSSSL